MTKWIGGGTLALVAALGGLAFAGRSLEAQTLDPQAWLQPQDVLADSTQVAASAPPAAAPAPAPTATQVPDSPPDSPFVIKRILPIEGAIKYGDWHWDEAGVAPGPIVMTVDLEARVISVFRGGYEIGAAAVLLGTQDHPTPLGSFPILSKERHNVSEKYNNAPMPFTLRLTADGVSIHGSEVENGYASHGCIGVPNDFAAKVFAVASKGDRVIITRGQQAGLGSSLAS